MEKSRAKLKKEWKIYEIYTEFCCCVWRLKVRARRCSSYLGKSVGQGRLKIECEREHLEQNVGDRSLKNLDNAAIHIVPSNERERDEHGEEMLVAESKLKTEIGRPLHRWKINIKMHLKERNLGECCLD